MIDIHNEQLVPIREVPRLLPPRRTGRPVHLSVCYRWLSRGVRGVRLEALKVGGTTYTSLEALQRFAERLSAEHQGDGGVGTLRNPKRLAEVARRVEGLLRADRRGGTQRPGRRGGGMPEASA